jgi:CheY-like chemotaxis protein
MIGEDITLRLHTSAEAERAFIDPGQLEQVIMNLVVNARDAMPDGGQLTVETSSVVVDEAYAASHAGIAPGAYVLLVVTDTGCGMDRATQDRVFEPFFTTKEQGRGTGLGLSMVYGIVRQSGGHIWLASELGHGTTFQVYLPRTDRIAEPAVEAQPSVGMRGSETILLVEDEDPVRHVVRSILTKGGYHVLEAQNAGEAVLVCEQYKAKIHLLLTDVVMPRMSGYDLAERLAALRPDMRSLFVSGYTESAALRDEVIDAGVEFLAKPILPDPLLRKVRQILDGRSRRSSSTPAD